MRFVEFVLPRLIDDFSFVVDEDSEMPTGVYAFYNPAQHELHVANSVYCRAYHLTPRDLFTIAHELSHALLLENDTVVLARQINTKPYLDPEWQANELAAALLAPAEEVKTLTPGQAMQRYHISYQVAQIQTKK